MDKVRRISCKNGLVIETPDKTDCCSGVWSTCSYGLQPAIFNVVEFTTLPVDAYGNSSVVVRIKLDKPVPSYEDPLCIRSGRYDNGIFMSSGYYCVMPGSDTFEFTGTRVSPNTLTPFRVDTTSKLVIRGGPSDTYYNDNPRLVSGLEIETSFITRAYGVVNIEVVPANPAPNTSFQVRVTLDRAIDEGIRAFWPTRVLIRRANNAGSIAILDVPVYIGQSSGVGTRTAGVPAGDYELVMTNDSSTKPHTTVYPFTAA